MDSYICPKCGKQFPNNTNLKRHIAVHNKQGRYFCCGKPFQDMYHLRMHRASKHGAPKTFCCTTCNKSFANANDLKRHRKNENKQDFITCQCEFKARDKNALGEHLSSHQEDSTHACNACKKVYKHRSNLSRHKKLKHK